MTVPEPAKRVEPLTVESELRLALSGCALVGEIDLDSTAARAAGEALNAVAPASRHRLGRLYPACLCVALVRHGAANYRRNGFWDGFDTWGLPDRQVGTQFLEALSSLGLERFDRFLSEDKARRYVAHALLHAGFPRPAAVQVFRLLAESLRLGAGDGPSIVNAWRRDPVLMESLRSPARRFVQHGGDLVVDLVDRMVDLLVAAADGDVDATSFGLPSHVAAAFTDLNLSERRVGQRRRLPAPVVIIEPGTGIGPTVILPAVPQRAAHEWLVSTGQQKTRRRVSAGSEQTVEIHPAVGWSVVAQTDGRAVRSFEFRGFGRNVYVFSPDGILLDPQKPVRHDRVIVLAPSTFECRVDSAEGEPAAIVEEFPPLGGSWHSYSLQDVFVGGTTAIWLGPGLHASGMAAALGGENAGGVAIPIGASTERPVLVGEPVLGAAWSGWPVFAVAPRICLPLNQAALHRWMIRVESHTGQTRQASAGDLNPEDGLVSIGSMIGCEAWAGSVTAYGPLGRDLRGRFAVVPGLTVDADEEVIAPDSNVPVTVSASLSIDGDPGPWVHVLSPPADTTTVTFGDVDVDVSVRRLLWCVRSENAARTVFGNDVVTIAAGDIRSGVDDLLFVRGRPGSEVYVRLAHRDAVLHEAKPVKCGSHGIATVALKQFADTVRSGRDSTLGLT